MIGCIYDIIKMSNKKEKVSVDLVSRDFFLLKKGMSIKEFMDIQCLF